MLRLSTLFIVITAFVAQEHQKNPLAKSAAKDLKPEVKLSCLPRIALATPGRPATVWATLRILHPDEKIWCPGISWYADGNFQGSVDSDCAPFEDARESRTGELEWWSDDASRRFMLWPGKHRISARLTKSGKVIRSTECVVYVR